MQLQQTPTRQVTSHFIQQFAQYSSFETTSHNVLIFEKTKEPAITSRNAPVNPLDPPSKLRAPKYGPELQLTSMDDTMQTITNNYLFKLLN